MTTSRSILCSMDDFIQSKQVDKAVPFHDTLKMLKLKTNAFHDSLKMLKLKTNASDGVIKKRKNSLAHLLCQVTLVTSFNKRSGRRNLANH